MTKTNFKKSVMTSFQCRHHNYVIEKCHQTSEFFLFRPVPSNQNSWLCQWVQRTNQGSNRYYSRLDGTIMHYKL